MPLILVCTTNRQQFRTNVSHYELFAIRFPSHHGRNLLNRATRHGRPNGAETVFVPLTVGGGVRGVDDVDVLLRAGADKVGVNTAAIAHPGMIDEVADRFGNQVIVLSVDARREPDRPSGFGVTTHGGTRSAGLDAVEWACQAVERGAGEILLNSMDADGTADGFDIEMIEAVRAAVDVPLIASGGAGKVADFVEAARAGVDAVLAASVFHYHTLTIAQIKDGLRHAGFEVR